MFGSRKGPVKDSCEDSNEPSASIKYREFLDWFSNYWLLTKNSAPYSKYFSLKATTL
jgi:hypothetical protein